MSATETVRPAPHADESPYHPYRATLLQPERVRQLSVLRPYRMVIDTLWCWLWIVAAWSLVAIFPHWWTVLLAIPVIGSSFYGLFIIGHDGLHRRLFNRQWLNDLFNDLFIMGSVGAVTRLNNRNHLRHHLHLASPRDPDRHKYGCFNKAVPAQLFGYLVGATSVLRSVRNVFAVTPADERAPPARGGDSKDRYTLRDLAILAGWQLMLIGGLTAAIGIWAYPVLWLLPVFVFTVLADNLRSFLEHARPEADAAADKHRLITYRSNWLERRFLSPMNMNYHAAHHLWPSIPYYNLPQADHEMQCETGVEGLQWRGSYLRFLWRYFRSLPLDECREKSQVNVSRKQTA